MAADPFQIALRYLERRARTEYELRQKLAAKKVAPSEIDTVIERLKGYGYINDLKFAKDWQRYRDDFKPMGKRRLKLELSLKGVPKEAIATVEVDPEKEYRLALEAAESRLRQYRLLDPPTWRRRLTGFLGRRGFGYETIKRVLADLDGPVSDKLA